MADTTALKNRIRAAIKANDNQEITGPVLQQALLDMVDELNGATETEADARQTGDSALLQSINSLAQTTSQLQTAVRNLRDAGYAFGGIAVIDTNPGIPTANCFYIVRGAGTYTHFKDADNESIVLSDDGIYVLTYESVENNYWEWNNIIGINDKLVAGSHNLVDSSGILQGFTGWSIDSGATNEMILELYIGYSDISLLSYIDVNLLYGNGPYYNAIYGRKADGSLWNTLYTATFQTLEEAIADLQTGQIKVYGTNRYILFSGKTTRITESVHKFLPINDLRYSPRIANYLAQNTPSENSNRLFTSGGAYNLKRDLQAEIQQGGSTNTPIHANDFTDSPKVNKLIKYINQNIANLNNSRAHFLGIGSLVNGRYYNMLYIRRGESASTAVFEDNFATFEEAIADFKSKPVRDNYLCTVEFNVDAVGSEPILADFHFLNDTGLNANNTLYRDKVYAKELFKPKFGVGNTLIAEILHFETDGYFLDNILVSSFCHLDSTTNKYVIDLQSVYEGSSTRYGNLIRFDNFDTQQEAFDYWNDNIGGHVLPMIDGKGYVLYNKITNIGEIIRASNFRIYLDKDTSLIQNAPTIANYLGGLNNIFLFDTKLNLLVDELYINPSEIDYNTINAVRICIGGTIGSTIYNLVYVYRTGGLSTRVLWQQTYDTVDAAISGFKGIHGNIYGYIKANDKFVEQFYKGFYYDVQPSQLNLTRLSLECCPKIAEFINPINALANKSVVWEGDSIAAGNAYGSEAWRRPIELKYGMIGVNYSRGGSTITNNLPELESVYNMAARIDAEVAANPNMQYFIFDGGTNDADRIGRIVKWKANTEQTIHERTTPENWPAKFGTWNETDFSGNYDKDTFCGALEYIIWKVMSSCRYVKIGYIVAQKMGVSTGLTFFNRLEYFREAMAICKKWGVPVINLWEDSWMNSNMPNQYDPSLSTAAEHVANGDFYVDTQHPAPAGYDYLSKLIGEWMNDL